MTFRKMLDLDGLAVVLSPTRIFMCILTILSGLRTSPTLVPKGTCDWWLAVLLRYAPVIVAQFVRPALRVVLPMHKATFPSTMGAI